MSILRPFSLQLLSVLRIMAGLLLLEHGTGKYLNFPIGPMNNASPQTMGGAAGLFELVGGVLLVLGLFTRPVAFILSGMTAIAYFYAHAPRGFFPILNGGELAILYYTASFSFIWPQRVAAPGAWSAFGSGRRIEQITCRRNRRICHDGDPRAHGVRNCDSQPAAPTAWRAATVFGLPAGARRSNTDPGAGFLRGHAKGETQPPQTGFSPPRFLAV
jgi:putative oxidoreductase